MENIMGFLKGKRAVIVGVASPRSIAWGIANAMHEQGAELASCAFIIELGFLNGRQRLGDCVINSLIKYA